MPSREGKSDTCSIMASCPSLELKCEGKRVKLIAGLLCPTGEPELAAWAERRMTEELGEVERRREPSEWRYTNYYDDISPDLSRIFFSFKGASWSASLAAVKRAAVEIERESSSGGGRRVNIDPGYIDGSSLVLASTKDAPQRIYIGLGIYAEVTMMRRRSGWEKFFYTFPDFASGEYDAFFDLVRADRKREVTSVDR